VEKRAVILAGGLGTRLRPYTAVLPKPLMPVGDRPILDIIVRQLRRHGFERLTIVTGHLAELIEVFFGDGERYDVEIDYFRESEPLGTVGALALLDGLGEHFLVMNGDVLTDLDFGLLLAEHGSSGATATIASHTRDVQVSLGVLKFGDEGDANRITGFVEKPLYHYDVSMGVYAFSRRVIEFIEPGKRLDFPDLVLRLLDAGEQVRARRPREEDYWLDIGRHDDYETAVEEFERIKQRFLPEEAATA
jgi:NDP-sugar pyrophosphorylase family protein